MHISLESSWCWLSFPHKKKSGEMKTQSSSGSWVEFCLPRPTFGGWTFSGLFILFKNTWGRWGWRRHPPRAPFRGQFWQIKKNKKSDFFSSFFYIFLFVFYFLSFFSGLFCFILFITLWGRWQCRRRSPWHLFWGNFEK